MLRQKYPDILIQGDNYPPPPHKLYLAQFLGIFKILLIACVVSGANIFAMFGFPDPPQWFNSLTQHKLYSCMMIFFLSNAIEGQLISTGAFEIWFNDVPLWSKLDVGRLPNPPELFQIIDNQLGFRQHERPPGLGFGDAILS